MNSGENSVDNHHYSHLILASQSTARQAILATSGTLFTVQPAPVEEKQLQISFASAHMRPRDQAEALASAKAKAISLLNRDALVIGADQILELEGQALHKVSSLWAAHQRLASLAGRTHLLHSALCLHAKGHRIWQYLDTSVMIMRALKASEITDALAAEGDEIVQSTGCYRIEGPSISLFERINGDKNSIMGLPLSPLLAALRQYMPDAAAGNTG